jgi:hypothetical protein
MSRQEEIAKRADKILHKRPEIEGESLDVAITV